MSLKWLAPPQADDPYQHFAKRVLHYTLLLLLAFMVLALPFRSPIGFLYVVVVITLLLTSYILLHCNRPRLASGIFLAGAWALITSAVLLFEGFGIAGMSAYAIVIIYSAVLFPGWSVILVTLLSLFSAALILQAETLDIISISVGTSEVFDLLYPLAALFITSGSLLWLASRAIRRTMDQLTLSEQSLKEKNKRLAQEIHERRLMENELRTSEERYRILFDNSQIMASVYDSEGRISLINQAACEMLGRPAEEIIGKSVFDVLPPEVAARAQERHERVRKTGVAEFVEGRTARPSGGIIHFFRQVVPLPEANGKREILTLTMDVTAQKIAEEQEIALKLAAERADFLTEFFGTISHDLKSPLTVLTTTLYLLEHAKTEEQRQRNLQRIKENLEVLQDYIQDMLAFARLEHLPAFERKPMNIVTLLNEVLKRLRPRAEGKQITIQTEFAPNVPHIPVSSDHLLSAFLNLVENAIAYTPEEGRITLKTAVISGGIQIEVSDTGVGIAPEEVENVFGRFYRGTAAQQMEKSGSGLGLSIVKQVIDLHEGTIRVESAVGKGTTFIVTLPGKPAEVPPQPAQV